MATRAMPARLSRVRGVGTSNGALHEVGQPETNDEDYGTKDNVAAKFDEQRDDIADLAEFETIRRLHSRKQHGEEQEQHRHQSRRLRAAGENARESKLRRQLVETHAVQQAPDQPARRIWRT